MIWRHGRFGGDNRLALLDQAAFLRLRATGQGSVVQCTWVYRRAVDTDELRRFQMNLNRGLLGRRIERSPLPFGRHRWVVGDISRDIDRDIDIATVSRPRADLGAWVEQRARIGVDPERGPTFHLGLLPLDDGGSAVSLVASHCVVDGVGLATAVAAAVKGEGRNLSYPQSHSRGWWEAVCADMADAVRAIPGVIRALIATALIVVRLGTGARRGISARPTSPAARRQIGGADDEASLAAVTMQIDAVDWDGRARALHGSSNTLFIAFGARLAQRMSRTCPDGHTVTVIMPVSQRTAQDHRANALTSITVTVDARTLLDDLSAVRADVKSRLTAMRQHPNELLAGLPLIPFTPRWVVRRAEGMAMANDSLPVGCSNLGDFDAVVARIDGGDGAELSMRLAEQGVARRRIESSGGQLFCGTGTMSGSRFITVVAYQCGAENTQRWVRELAQRTLADLRLTASTVH